MYNIYIYIIQVDSLSVFTFFLLQYNVVIQNIIYLTDSFSENVDISKIKLYRVVFMFFNFVYLY